MEAFDNYINSIITPKSVGAGVGTVFLTFFTGKLAPKLPKRFYDLLDNTLVRIVLTAYLLNNQIHAPSLSVLIAMIIVIGFEVVVKIFAPDSPSLAELVKETATEENGEGKKSAASEGCNCYCGHTIYAEHPNDVKSGKNHVKSHVEMTQMPQTRQMSQSVPSPFVYR